MSITASISNSFVSSVLTSAISDTFKIALYNSSASLGPDTTAYTTTNECTGNNYTAGGVALTGAAVWTDQNVVGITFDNPSFTNITVSDIRGFMIYDTTRANVCVMVMDLGSTFSVTSQTLTIQIPNPLANTGLLKFLN